MGLGLEIGCGEDTGDIMEGVDGKVEGVQGRRDEIRQRRGY
jgi:hypothetical protein